MDSKGTKTLLLWRFWCNLFGYFWPVPEEHDTCLKDLNKLVPIYIVFHYEVWHTISRISNVLLWKWKLSTLQMSPSWERPLAVLPPHWKDGAISAPRISHWKISSHEFCLFLRRQQQGWLRSSVTATLRTSPAHCAIRAVHKKASPVKSGQKLSFSPRSDLNSIFTLYTQQPFESLHLVDLQPLKEKQSWMGTKVLPTWKMHTLGMLLQMISKLVQN